MQPVRQTVYIGGQPTAFRARALPQPAGRQNNLGWLPGIPSGPATRYVIIPTAAAAAVNTHKRQQTEGRDLRNRTSGNADTFCATFLPRSTMFSCLKCYFMVVENLAFSRNATFL